MMLQKESQPGTRVYNVVIGPATSFAKREAEALKTSHSKLDIANFGI